MPELSSWPALGSPRHLGQRAGTSPRSRPSPREVWAPSRWRLHPTGRGRGRIPGEPSDNPSHGTILWLIPAHSRVVPPWVRPPGVTCPSGPQSHSKQEFSSSSWKTKDPPRTGWREGMGKGPARANINPMSSTLRCPPQRRQTAVT